jgi:2-dehydro-3-deoxy-L-rhamnonate dehydrogenase (NAD+)
METDIISTYLNLTDSVVIVTGGSSGIGLAIAEAATASKAKVVVFDLKKDLNSNENRNSGILFKEVDVTIEQSVQQAINEVYQKYGRIDALVNCAGITGITNMKSHETSTENIRHVFEVNFMGSYFTSKYVLPIMIQKNYGRLIHVASIAGKEGNAGMLAYSASKAAVIGMAKVQGKEYAEKGITVNAIAPAVIRTPLVDAMPEEQVKYMTDKIPMKRCGTLSEIANLALYIISSQNSFTTGFTFDLSGGRATY